MSRVLVVEDRDTLRQMMRHALEQAGHAVHTAADTASASEQLTRASFDLVLTDLKLPDGSGIDVVAAVRGQQPRTPVVVLTAFGTVDHAVEAMKLGAVDFLEKPLELDELLDLVSSHTADAAAEAAVINVPGGMPIVAGHPTMRAALRLLRKVAPTESTVLLTGESGTGKELFARALHAFSARSKGSFVAINCAAIPETLIENELFGHEKGAFTGAARRQRGRFEQAARGTLFLDEIGELDIRVQGKILRVLEERIFERIGGGQPIRSDVRLIAATNRDLEAMTADGSFRSDLYFRLEVFPIALPPLRARTSDIAPIARLLVEQISAKLGRDVPKLESDAETLLTEQAWPGNVRQLANVLERLLILDDEARLTAHSLRPLLAPRAPLDERTTIREALEATAGDKQAAARSLGISYRTLQRKVRALDLEGFPRYRT